jgi:hypothetical protein
MAKNGFSLLLVLLTICPAVWGGKPAPNQPYVVSGSAIRSGDSLIAGSEGATFRTSSGYELELAPTTCIRSERPTKLQLAISASTPTQVLELLTGRVDVRSPRNTAGPQALMITAPHKVMAVFTTGNGIVLASAKAVTVASERGGMLVGVAPNDWRPLREGYARTISAEDRTGRPRPLLAMPVVRSGSGLILDTGAATSVARATWAPVPDAVRYEVSMVAKAGATTDLITHEPLVEFGGLEPGTYTVTVRAVDQYGLSGPVSQPQEIRVVRPILPPGAYVGSDGAIRLETHDRLRLAGAEGVWMSHGKANQFVPFPDSVGLFRGTAVEIHLRAPQSSAVLPLYLVPQIDHASINFEPRRPRWPDQAVTIEVELYDGHDQPVAESVEAVIDLSINRRRLPTQWRRQGGRRITQVRPTSPLGPWSLKVRVARPSGEIVAGSSVRIQEL